MTLASKKYNPMMPTGLFYLNSLIWSTANSRVSGLSLLLPFFIEILVFIANSVGPDQMPHSVASHLGLHCLPNVPFRHKWVKENTAFAFSVHPYVCMYVCNFLYTDCN